MKRFLTSVSLQHEPKASDVITLVKKTFFARVSYEILYHEVWNKIFYITYREYKNSNVPSNSNTSADFYRISLNVMTHVWISFW